MTVNSTKITSGPYVGNNIADTFSYTFKVDDKTQLSVYQTTDTGVETLLTVDTDYTVSGVGDNNGGIITRVAGALPTDYEWYIRSDYEETQLTAFSSQGAFFPDLHENAMDKMTFLIQQLLDRNDRSPRVSDSFSGVLPLTLSNPVAGFPVRWNGGETGLENYDPSTVSNEEIANDKVVIKYDSILQAVNDPSIKLNQACDLKERTTGNGGGGVWDVVLTSSVTPNTRNIVICISVPTLTLVLRTKNTLFAEQWGVSSANADNQPILQAMVDLKPKEILIDSYNLDTLSTLVVDDNIKISAGINARLANDGCRIKNLGTGDCIQWSDTKVIYNGGLSNIALQATNGHALSIGFGAVRSVFQNLTLYTTDINKSCVAALYSGTIGVDYLGMYSCVFEGGEYIVDNVARNVPIIDLVANNTAINENIFQNLWVTQSKSFHAIRLACTVAGPYLTNNSFRNLNFEICSGGGIVMQGTSHTEVSGVSFWDTPLGYDGSLVAVDPTTSVNQNRGLTITNMARQGNSLNGAAKDIDLGYSLNTVITNHSPVTSAAAKIDCQNRSCVIIGGENATVTNDGATTYVRGGNTEAPTFIATKFETNNGRVIDDGSDMVLEAPASAAGLKSTVSGNTIALLVNGNTFFGGGGAILPSTDNTINLGHSTNRLGTIYAGTGAINTSDEREKTELLAIDDKERLVAVELKSQIKKFRFKDAVKVKGSDARIHFGVGAQTVKSVFEKHGLDGFDYALLCYDQWDDLYENDVLTVKAGNRYGIRYEELICFIIAASGV